MCQFIEHSASNAGMPTDPHSPESNSSYLARQILLMYLMHSQQVDWLRHDQINIFVSNFNVDTVDTAKTHLYSLKFKSELVK